MVKIRGIESQLFEICQDGSVFYTTIGSLYLVKSLYYYQLKKCFSLFERKQVLIIKSEDLLNKPNVVLSNIYIF